MALSPEALEGLYAAMRAGRKVRIRLDDGRGGQRSARSFVGVPTVIGPWGGLQEPHVMMQMVGAHGTLVAVAVQLERVVAVDFDVR
jgi:hypothetical protein